MTEIEQAARNVAGIANWWHPEYGMRCVTPFPWTVGADRDDAAGVYVTIIAADGQVLISDTTRECDPAFWTALVGALNTLAQTIAPHAATGEGK